MQLMLTNPASNSAQHIQQPVSLNLYYNWVSCCPAIGHLVDGHSDFSCFFRLVYDLHMRDVLLYPSFMIKTLLSSYSSDWSRYRNLYICFGGFFNVFPGCLLQGGQCWVDADGVGWHRIVWLRKKSVDSTIQSKLASCYGEHKDEKTIAHIFSVLLIYHPPVLFLSSAKQIGCIITL